MRSQAATSRPSAAVAAAAVALAALLAACAPRQAAANPFIMPEMQGGHRNDNTGYLHSRSMHTVFSAECNSYFDWQSLALVYSHRKAGVLGPITRLLSCSEEELKTYKNIDIVPTHVAPSYTHNLHNNDTYTAYNKPAAILHWLQSGALKEEWVLILDPDMVIRDHFADWGRLMGAERGWALSVYFDYMQGVYGNLSDTHIPDVPIRWDAIGGPRGRRADQVSSVVLMERNDLQAMAPLWLNYSEGVRDDPHSWNTTGDEYAAKKGPGTKPWIAEMYGYAFAAAKAGVFHRIDHAAMLYPGTIPIDRPLTLHYGRQFEVAGYVFSKHWFHSFNPFQCPSWPHMKPPGTTDVRGGLFPHPPHPTVFWQQPTWALYRDLLSVQVITTINAALCEHHLRACPPSDELQTECAKAKDLEQAVDAALAQVEATKNDFEPICYDIQGPNCGKWAMQGKCFTQPVWMHNVCRYACELCRLPSTKLAKPFNWNMDPEVRAQPRPKKPVWNGPISLLSPEAEERWSKAAQAAKEVAATISRAQLAQQLAQAAKAAASDVVRTMAEVQQKGAGQQHELSLAAETTAAEDPGAGSTQQQATGSAPGSLSMQAQEHVQGQAAANEQTQQRQGGQQQQSGAASSEEVEAAEEQGRLGSTSSGQQHDGGANREEWHSQQHEHELWQQAVEAQDERQQQLSREEAQAAGEASMATSLGYDEDSTSKQAAAGDSNSSGGLPWQRGGTSRGSALPGGRILWAGLGAWALLAGIVVAAAKLGGIGAAGIRGAPFRVKAKLSFIQREIQRQDSGASSGAATPSSATSTASAASMRQALLLHRAGQSQSQPSTPACAADELAHKV